MSKDIIKRYRRNGFTLTLWDTGKPNGRGLGAGCTYLGYRLTDRGKRIFEGEDFSGSPLHCDDSLDTVASILGFLSLRPGDTDREYFDKYTPDQLAWVAERAEELSMVQYELEERCNRKRERETK